MTHKELYDNLKEEIQPHLKDQKLKFSDFFRLELTLSVIHWCGENELGAFWVIFGNYHNLGLTNELRKLVRKLSMIYNGRSSSHEFLLLVESYMELDGDRNLFKIIHEEGGEFLDWKFIINPILPQQTTIDRLQTFRTYLETYIQTESLPMPVAEPGFYYRYSQKENNKVELLVPQFPPQPPIRSHTIEQGVRSGVKVKIAELVSVAEDMGKIDSGRDWSAQMRNVQANLVDPRTGERINELDLSKTHQLIGLVSVGKSTLIDILAIWGHRTGHRITIVLNDVSSQLSKQRLYRKFGVKAIPLFGKSSLHERSAESFDQLSEEIQQTPLFDTFDDLESEPTHFEYLNNFCLLNGFLRLDQRIEDEQPPCYSIIDREKNRYRCPFVEYCPRYKDYQEILESNVWLVNPNSLIQTSLDQPFVTQKAPIIEFVYRLSDLVIVDEVDLIQARIDDIFSNLVKITGTDSLADFPIDAEVKVQYQDFRLLNQQTSVDFYELLLDYKKAESNLISQLITTGNHNSTINWYFVKETVFNVDSMIRKLCKTKPYDQAEFLLPQLEALVDRKNLEDFLETGVLTRRNLTYQDFTHSLPSDLRQYINELQGSEDFNRVTEKAKDKIADPKTRFLIHLKFILSFAAFDLRLSAILDNADSYKEIFKIDMNSYRAITQDYFRYYRGILPAPIFVSGRKGYSVNQLERGGLSVEVTQYHAVGRYLIYHLHDLYEDLIGIRGPAVLLMSSTSWVEESDKYHVNVEPEYLIRATPKSLEELENSTMTFVKVTHVDRVSGRSGKKRIDNLYQLVESIIRGGHSYCQKILDELPENREHLLLVVGSYYEAREALRIFQSHSNWRDVVMCLVPDNYANKDDELHLYRSQVERLKYLGKKVLIAPSVVIERGKNILNQDHVSFFGAIGFLVRPYPVPYSFASLIGFINRQSIELYNKGRGEAQTFHEYGKQLKMKGGATFRTFYDNQVPFKQLKGEFLEKLVADMTILKLQVIGRTIRGETRTHIYLFDQAYIRNPELDNPLDDSQSYITKIIQFLKSKATSGDPVSKEIFTPIYNLFRRIKMEII